ncbi:UDP-N-acetylmuramate-alanine ligase [Bradyrhizobium diazoefficiens]
MNAATLLLRLIFTAATIVLAFVAHAGAQTSEVRIGICTYDDVAVLVRSYAHHPENIRTTLDVDRYIGWASQQPRLSPGAQFIGALRFKCRV